MRNTLRKSPKLQSAMEYLMTYGWAILVIAIVLGVLYYFGVFTSPFSTSACIPASGYVCQSPLLNSSGYLSITFAQVSGSGITLTGIACTNNITTPTSALFQGVSKTLQSGNQEQVIFKCPFSGLPIGAEFSGYLWIQYNTATQSGLLAKYATITGRVSSIKGVFGSGSLLSGVDAYVPITLTNNQVSATPAPFQQMITINSAAYANSINGAWTNVEFTTGPNGAGSTIPAWVESGNSNSSSSTVVWLYLSGGIGANSNTVVYMDFMSNSVMSASGPTGEAPQLSPTYAQYDNGANIFTNYWNWAGTSTPSGFQTIGGGSYTINNGLTFSGGSYDLYTVAAFSPPFVDEIYAKGTTCGSASCIGVLTWISGGSTTLSGTRIYNNQWQIYLSSSPTSFGSPAASAGTFYVLGTAVSSSFQGDYYNYNLLSSTASGGASTYYMVVGNADAGGASFEYWARMRAFPPNAVMPTASFGSFTSP